MFKHQRPIKWLRCHLETRPRRTPQETLCQNCASIFTWRSRIQHRADLFTEDTASYVAMTYGYWWEELETSVDLEGDYTPRAYDTSKGVEFNHNILAGGRSKQFDVSDQSYAHGLLLLGGLIVLIGLLASLSLACFVAIAERKGKEGMLDRLRGKSESQRGKRLMVLAVLALAAVACVIGGLADVDIRLTRIESYTADIAGSLQEVSTLPSRLRGPLDDVDATYKDARGSVEECQYERMLGKLDDDEQMGGFTQGVEDKLQPIASSGLGALAKNVDHLADSIIITRGIRKGVVWPAVSLCVVIVAVYILLGLAAWKRPESKTYGRWFNERLSPFVRPATIFLAFLIWMTAACSIILSAMSGDFCAQPDENAVALVGNSHQPSLGSTLEYYTGSCSTSNAAVESVSAAQSEAKGVIEFSMSLLYRLTGVCGEATPSVEALDASLKEVWGLLVEAGQLVSCSEINGQYQTAVYDAMCDDLPKGLLVLWPACAVLATLLLLMAVQWSWILRQIRAKAGLSDTAVKGSHVETAGRHGADDSGHDNDRENNSTSNITSNSAGLKIRNSDSLELDGSEVRGGKEQYKLRTVSHSPMTPPHTPTSDGRQFGRSKVTSPFHGPVSPMRSLSPRRPTESLSPQRKMSTSPRHDVTFSPMRDTRKYSVFPSANAVPAVDNSLSPERVKQHLSSVRAKHRLSPLRVEDPFCSAEVYNPVTTMRASARDDSTASPVQVKNPMSRVRFEDPAFPGRVNVRVNEPLSPVRVIEDVASPTYREGPGRASPKRAGAGLTAMLTTNPFSPKRAKQVSPKRAEKVLPAPVEERTERILPRPKKRGDRILRRPTKHMAGKILPRPKERLADEGLSQGSIQEEKVPAVAPTTTVASTPSKPVAKMTI